MPIGPFETTSFPGVYTKTLNEAPLVTAAGELRFPAFIGVGDETLPVNGQEMIRGSSSQADNPIVDEDVSSQLTGANRDFIVSFFPIVAGDGQGTVTNDPNKVVVTINGNPVPVANVDGATGHIWLVSIPAMGDLVLASYYFKRKDTVHTLEDLSIQADGTNTTFKTDYAPIVKGNNGGITTTTVSDVVVKVNNAIVSVKSLNGDSGIITLDSTPAAGALVQVTYYSNEYQDTADILPAHSVASVSKVGWTPTTSDFINGTDFVVDATSQFATINWGASYKIVSGAHTIGTTYFDSSVISATLFDNRSYRRPTTGLVDGTNKTFTLSSIPVEGTGLATATDDPSKILGYFGTMPSDATAKTVATLTPGTKVVTFTTAPVVGQEVFVTYYENKLTDDVWTLTNKVAGITGAGIFTIAGTGAGTAHAINWSNTDTSVNVSVGNTSIPYPNGTGASNGDFQSVPGYSINETITLTFQDANEYVVTSTVSSGTGSGGDNTGWLNQTYIDAKTGFRVTLVTPGSGSFQAGDYIGYISTTDFTCSATPTRSIPGIRTTVTTTVGIGAPNDTGIINTYNKDGQEPAIGDLYYVSFTKNKVASDYIAKLYTNESNLTSDLGPINGTNKVVLAAHLCFLNGATALAVKQIVKTAGGSDAPDSAYITAIDEFNEPMVGGLRPSLLEPVTTSTAVLNYLKQSNLIQGGQRYGNERMSYFGFAVGTTPTTAQVYARSMNCEQMVGIYPDGAITTMTDSLGVTVDILVDGSLLAAAMAGVDVSPAFDVATPLTRKPVSGFTRLYRRLDSVTQAQTANAGLTLLEEMGASIIIKMDLTTDLTSVLTRTPSVVRTKQYVQKGTRAILTPYIGQKNLPARLGEIETTLNSYLASLKRAEIIVDFTGVKATVDPNDATTVNVVAYYAPVFPLLWILVTFNLRSRLS